MSAQLTDEEALNRVASYCSTAEHCRAEINEKLQRWGIAYDTIARILDRLESEKFIDDERFCRAFVNDKFRFAKWGKMKIVQGLYMKKIPSDVAWRYLNEIDEEEYLSILRDLLTSKRKSIHAADDYELNGKLMRLAMSRGFELKDIKDAVPQRTAQVPPERIPELFRDKRVEEWRASEADSSGRLEDNEKQTENSDDVDTDELNEELEDLNCARDGYQGGTAGIGPEEIDLIIDLCNGKEIPTDKRLALLRAIHHIKDTQIERSILESINGSDSRISKFLDEAERMSEAAPDSD